MGDHLCEVSESSVLRIYHLSQPPKEQQVSHAMEDRTEESKPEELLCEELRKPGVLRG